MANFLTDVYRNNILGLAGFTNVQLDADDVRAMFIDNADDTVIAANEDLADVAAGARVPAAASCPALGTKTIGSVAVGTFDAADTVFTALTGDQVEQLILYVHTGTDATSLLILAMDTFGSGMPLTPNGGNVTVTWNASGIFQV